jgi:cyclic pyranopterin phosphate synthase
MIRDTCQRPLHDLRISVIDACNFRCPYCMPEANFPTNFRFLPKRQWLTFEELVRIARLSTELGVRKVRITGGEPLLRRQLPEFVRDLVALAGIEDVALTTNGYYLARDAAGLREAGLHRLNISLDAIDDEVCGKMNGRGVTAERVLDGIAAAQAVGFDRIKVNAVIRRGTNDDQVIKLATYAREQGVTLRFIEFMDVGNMNAWERAEVVPSAELVQVLDDQFGVAPLEPNYRGEVATRYGYRDGRGEVGFISSVTQPFCGDCHRARLTSNGKLYTCLFATNGVDLKEPLREGSSDDELLAILRGTWAARTDRYSEERAAGTASSEKVEMHHVGG